MAKKVNSKKIDAKNISNENEMIRFIKTIVIVTIIFAVFYVLTMLINKKEDPETEKPSTGSTVSIGYDEILIGNIFNQNNKNYYVLIEDVDDLQVQVYEVYLNMYQQKDGSKEVYTVKLNNMFNSKYIGEKSNLDNDISKFKVSGTVLLEISNKKIVNSYETKDEILELLKEISKEESNEE